MSRSAAPWDSEAVVLSGGDRAGPDRRSADTHEGEDEEEEHPCAHVCSFRYCCFPVASPA